MKRESFEKIHTLLFKLKRIDDAFTFFLADTRLSEVGTYQNGNRNRNYTRNFQYLRKSSVTDHSCLSTDIYLRTRVIPEDILKRIISLYKELGSDHQIAEIQRYAGNYSSDLRI